ncbi:MAG TPA: bile acid:sodium symporter [Jiangellaceae bacterium]|nr:bile acid:sodium symporter [Jiangellaceae bacterium]
MSVWERLQGVFVAASALAGLAAGFVLPIGPVAGHFVVPALMLMLVGVFTQISAGQLGEAGRGRRVVAASLVINFVWTPALAWALGAGLLGFSPDLRIGLLMLLVTPCTDWYLVFTGIARGHLGIAGAVLPVNLVLQLALLPVYVVLLGGTAISIDIVALGKAVGLVLLVPLGVAALLRWASTRARGGEWRDEVVVPAAARTVAPLLYAAVFVMFAWQGRLAIDHAAELAALLLPLAVFFTVSPLVATVVSRALVLPREQRVTLTMVTVARNSPVALALAATAFPDRPLIAVSLVIAPLIELPILAVISQLVRGPGAQRADLGRSGSHDE